MSNSDLNDPSSNDHPDNLLPNQLTHDLIRANHILHHYGAVDAFGHVSVRSPVDPEVYVIAGYMSPALISHQSHLTPYSISTSSPLFPDRAPKGYSERFIHGETYRRYPGVNCVVHSHARDCLPFSIVSSEVKLKPVIHMAAFLPEGGVPVWDIRNAYKSLQSHESSTTALQSHGPATTNHPDSAEKDQEESHDMLVKNSHLGASLAAAFSPSTSDTTSDTASHDPPGNPPAHTTAHSPAKPENVITLMAHHGFTAIGPDIQTALYRVIYTITNARVQLNSMSLSQSVGGSVDVNGLTGKVAEDTAQMNERTQDKAWPMWMREVEVNPLYRCEI